MPTAVVFYSTVSPLIHIATLTGAANIKLKLASRRKTVFDANQLP